MSFAEFFVHFLIAALLVVVALRRIILRDVMYMRWRTRLSMRLLFVASAANQYAIAVAAGSTTRDVIGALQAVGLVLTLGWVWHDEQRIVKRTANALAAIREEFDGLAVVRGVKGKEMIEQGAAERLDCGSVVTTTLSEALLGHDEE